MLLTDKTSGIHLNKKLILIATGIWMLASLSFITPAMAIGSAAYFCLLTGVLYRKNKTIHVPLMNIGILLDLCLVAILELQRHAIDTALSMKLHPLQQLHILVSIIAVVLYFYLLASGWLKIKEKTKFFRFMDNHRTLGPWAFLFRSLSYALMFSMLMSKP